MNSLNTTKFLFYYVSHNRQDVLKVPPPPLNLKDLNTKINKLKVKIGFIDFCVLNYTADTTVHNGRFVENPGREPR